MPGGPKSADYLQPDPDILCARLEDLLMDICRIQRRKTGKFLQNCIKEAWALSHGEVKTFAQRLQAGLEHIYLKKKQATSGKKLAPAVARIIKLLSKEGLAEVPNASEQGKEDLQNLSPEQVSKLYEKFGVDTVPELAASSSSQLVPIEVCSSQEILASQASAAPPDVNYKQYTCSRAVALVRLFPDGSQTTATMKVGPGSFALGCFSSEEEHESEIPNSMVLAMDPKVKKAAKAAAKAAAMALKRPASKAPADSGSLKAMKKPAAAPVGLPKCSDASNHLFAVMHYKNSNSYAIRAKTGTKAQLFCVPFGERTPQQVFGIVKDAVAKLTAGDDVQAVKEWARSA